MASMREVHHSRRASLNARGRGGFTLIELMVVIIVIGIVAGAIIPNMAGSIGTIRLDGAAGRVAALLDYCYNAANSSGRVHGLLFDAEGRRFQVVAEYVPDPAYWTGAYEEPRLESIRLPGLLDSALPEGIVLSGVGAFEDDLIFTEDGGVRILFFPDGTTEFATLYLADTRGEERYVSINGVSGTVTITNPADEPPED